MILDRYENASLYKGIHPGIDAILEKVLEFNADNFPEEKQIIEEGRIFMIPNNYKTHSPDGASFEAHRAFIDVMCMIEGEETIYVKNVNRLSKITKEYDEEKDYLLANFDADRTPVRLEAGFFCILFPEDAHAPGCHADGEKAVKKFVGKVHV